jgi:hypothetical protein
MVLQILYAILGCDAKFRRPYPAVAGKGLTVKSPMSSKKTLRLRGANGRFVKSAAPVVVQTMIKAPVPAMVETTPVAIVEASEVAVVEIPNVKPEELIVTREGFTNIPPKAYKTVLKVGYDKPQVRQAIAAMKALSIPLVTALSLTTLGCYKQWHLPLLVAIKGANDFVGHTRVLRWMWYNKGWTFVELYGVFPNGGKEGVATSGETRWKARNLISLLDGIRKADLARKADSQRSLKTPQKVIDALCEQAYYLGWFE